MPQIVRTTSAPMNVSTWTKAEIDAIRASMTPGKNITAYDMNRLITAIYSCTSHKHTVDDLAYSAYGNTPAYGTTQSVNTTGSANFTITPMITIASLGGITAANINALISNINMLRTHNHSINDNWY